MSENKSSISNILEKIAADIKRNEINSIDVGFRWKRLLSLFSNEKNEFSNKFIKIYVEDNVEGKDRELLVSESFCQQFKAGHMFIFVYGCGKTTKTTNIKYILAAQSNEEAKIVELNDISSDQPELIRIVNLIDRQINNIDKFIKDYLNGAIF